MQTGSIDPRSNGTESGDPACWAHLWDDVLPDDPAGVVFDLAALGPLGEEVHHLPAGRDLDAGVARLARGHGTPEQVDEEHDVLLLALSGSGALTMDGHRYGLRRDVVAVVPRGCRHSIAAGVQGLSYLVVRRTGAAAPREPSEPAGHEHGGRA